MGKMEHMYKEYSSSHIKKGSASPVHQALLRAMPLLDARSPSKCIDLSPYMNISTGYIHKLNLRE